MREVSELDLTVTLVTRVWAWSIVA